MTIYQAGNIFTLAVLLVLAAVSGPAIAQGSGTEQARNETRQLLQAGREEIVRENLRLTKEESKAFWPVYRRYQDDLTPIRNRYADLLTEYIALYRAGTVTKAFADRIVDDYLEIETSILKVKKKHLAAFRAALPARKATRFYQLENQIDGQIAGQLAQIIPLIDPV